MTPKPARMSAVDQTKWTQVEFSWHSQDCHIAAKIIVFIWFIICLNTFFQVYLVSELLNAITTKWLIFKGMLSIVCWSW